MIRLRDFMNHGLHGNARGVDAGLFVLRVFTGLALITVFEKLLPRDGVWGPQTWFIDDVSAMGFPAPVLFAWLAVLTEFIGGLLLIVGLWTRGAALALAVVTATAAFVYHGADIVGSGLTATVFLVMTTSLVLAGPGRFSLDARVARRGSSPL